MGSQITVRLSALRALPPERSSGTHFFSGLASTGAILLLEELSKLKEKISILIGTRTRDLPICSVAAQLPTLSRVPLNSSDITKLI
jgi:hypothetical protein